MTAQGQMDLERKGKQSYQGWMYAVSYTHLHLLQFHIRNHIFGVAGGRVTLAIANHAADLVFWVDGMTLSLIHISDAPTAPGDRPAIPRAAS